MIINGKVCYNDGEEIKLGDLISLQLSPERWVVVEFAEVTMGQQVFIDEQGNQQVQLQKGPCFIGRGELWGQQIPFVEEIVSLPMEYVIDVEYEEKGE